jgi:peptidoglycan/xylan/chitin deacetylase (PgdA/CDA1 family)
MDEKQTQRSIKAEIRSAIEYAAAQLPFRNRAGRKLVLAYHGVRESDSESRGDTSLHIAEDKFAFQLQQLQKFTDVVALHELLAHNDDGHCLSAVTFDDAYVSALRLGLPICDTLGIPSTVFVSPGLLGTVPLWDKLSEQGSWSPIDRVTFLWNAAGGKVPMSEKPTTATDEAIRIATPLELTEAINRFRLLTLGNHTMNHQNLGALCDSDVLTEVREGHQWLLDFAVGRYIPVVAYPFGIAPRFSATPDVLTFARHAFLAAGRWSSENDIRARSAIPRWNIPDSMSAHGFLARLKGWSDSLLR